ncbi:MAG: hypothetical protein ACFFDT_10520 [Candidatus Hodarchaeota archaeon]
MPDGTIVHSDSIVSRGLYICQIVTLIIKHVPKTTLNNINHITCESDFPRALYRTPTEEVTMRVSPWSSRVPFFIPTNVNFIWSQKYYYNFTDYGVLMQATILFIAKNNSYNGTIELVPNNEAFTGFHWYFSIVSIILILCIQKYRLKRVS